MIVAKTLLGRCCKASASDGSLVSSGSSPNEISYNPADSSWGEQDSRSWWASTRQVRLTVFTPFFGRCV